MNANNWLGEGQLCVPRDTALSVAASRGKDDTGRRPLTEDESLAALDTKPKISQWKNPNWEPTILVLDRLIARYFKLHPPQRPARQVESVAAAIGICTMHVRLSFVSLSRERFTDACSVIGRQRFGARYFMNLFGRTTGDRFDRDDRTFRLENYAMDKAA